MAVVGSAAPAAVVERLGACIVLEDADPPDALAVAAATALWAPGPAVAAEAMGRWPQARTVVAPPTVDPAVFAPFPARRRSPEVQLRVVCTAPAGWRAGTEELLLALAGLRRAGVSVRAELAAGRGPDDEAARFACHDLGLDGVVTFRRLDRLAATVSMLWHADVLVLPAVVPGGWPQVAEAARCGVPIVATDHTVWSVAEQLEEGRPAGLRVVASRRPDELVDALARLAAPAPVWR
ncbi:MAG: glycosyltransferase [Acidimicrobiia bacterium]